MKINPNESDVAPPGSIDLDSQELKRKLEDQSDGPSNKKLLATPSDPGISNGTDAALMAAVANATAIAKAALASATAQTEEQGAEQIDCPEHLVGRLIGRGGETIRYLQNATQCNIQIDQNLPAGVPRKVTITGPKTKAKEAVSMVTDVMENGPPEIGPPPGTQWTTSTVDCEPGLVGRVIGRGGETIRDLQSRCGAKMQVDQDMPEGAMRKVIITGSESAVAAGVALVNQLLSGDLNLAPNSGPNVQYIDCPKNLVGRVIGRGGDIIRQLQQMSSCRIQIDQNVPEGTPCKVTISGSNPQTVSYAYQLVSEVMANGPQALQNHGGYTYSGGYGGYGGGGYGGYGGYGASGYGGYGQQGAYGGYGGYGDQSYGAYSGYSAGAPASAASSGGGSGEWSEHKMPDGTPYWYNSVTGVSQWEKPSDVS